MPRDEETVDRIFAGNLDGLPPLSSKVFLCSRFSFSLSLFTIWTGCRLSAQRSFLFSRFFLFPLFIDLFEGGAYLHQFHLHWHADGEEHVDGICLPQDQGVLSWEARTGVPGLHILNFSSGARSSQIKSRNTQWVSLILVLKSVDICSGGWYEVGRSWWNDRWAHDNGINKLNWIKQ